MALSLSPKTGKLIAFVSRLTAIIFFTGSSLFAAGIQQQMQQAPQNPDYLYEKRFIPGNENVQTVKIPQVKDSSSSASGDEGNGTSSTRGPGLSIKLNWQQGLLIAAVLIILVLYRVQVKKKRKQTGMRRR